MAQKGIPIILHLLIYFCFAIPSKSQEGFYLIPDIIQASDSQQTNLKIEPGILESITSLTGRLNESCTASLISGDGLLLSAFECLSPYLPEKFQNDKGFWAKEYKEEIPLKGLRISFTQSSKEVTDLILKGIDKKTSDQERRQKISRNTYVLIQSQSLKKGQRARVIPVNGGSRFFLQISISYPDIRLLGFPSKKESSLSLDTSSNSLSSNIAMLRVYTNANQKPALFSTDNVPMANKKHLKLSKSSTQNDLVFMLGFPTQSNFLASTYEIKSELIKPLAISILLDSLALNAIDPSLDKSKKIKAEWMNNKQMLARLQGQAAIDLKETLELEASFDDSYRKAWQSLDQYYKKNEELYRAYYYSTTTFKKVSTYQLAKFFSPLIQHSEDKISSNKILIKNSLEAAIESWNKESDQQLFASLSPFYFQNLKAHQIDPFLIEQVRAVAKDYNRLARLIYSESILADPEKLLSQLNKDPKMLKPILEKDLGFLFYQAIFKGNKNRIRKALNKELKILEELKRNYFIQFQKVNIKRIPTVEANGSMVLSYGNIYEKISLNKFSLAKYKSASFLSKFPGESMLFLKSNLIAIKSSQGSPAFESNGKLLGIFLNQHINQLNTGIYYSPQEQETLLLSSDYIYQYLVSKKVLD